MRLFIKLIGALTVRFQSVTAASAIVAIFAFTTDSQADLVYVSDTNAGTITQIDSSGNVSAFASGLNGPEGLAFDAAGNLYVADSGDGTISKITSGGSVSIFASGLNSPAALAFAPSGILYVANPGNETISKINSNGVVSGFATGISFDADGAHLASDSAGNIYANTTRTVEEFDPAGNRSTVYNTQALVEGMAVDGAGHLYVSLQNLALIDGNGGLKITVSNYPPPFNNDPSAAANQNTPSDLAFDTAGNLFAYFGQANNGTADVPGVILKFGSNGDNSVVATEIPGTSANSGYLAVVVPEPSGYTLLAMGCAALLSFSRRWK